MVKSCAACGTDVERDIPTGVFAELMAQIAWNCDECIEEEELNERLRREKREREEGLRLVEQRRLTSGVPEHLQRFDFEAVEATEELLPALGLVRRWARGDERGVLLSGSVGVGKTRLGVAAANEIIHRRPVKWFSAPMIMAQLGSGDFRSPARVALMDALLGSVALVLDDLDKVRPTEYAAETIFNAIDQRADGAGPLLVTLNMKVAEIATRWPQPYGEAIASRLSLMRGVRIIGKDRRS